MKAIAFHQVVVTAVSRPSASNCLDGDANVGSQIREGAGCRPELLADKFDFPADSP